MRFRTDRYVAAPTVLPPPRILASCFKHNAVAACGRAADPGQVPREEGGAEGAL
jgi:hypothetical protein